MTAAVQTGHDRTLPAQAPHSTACVQGMSTAARGLSKQTAHARRDSLSSHLRSSAA